jgi:hypothetical protein
MTQRSQRHKAEVHGFGTTPPVIGAWVAGVSTRTPVPIAAGKARCERLGAVSPPRIVKTISNLVVGKTYQISTSHYASANGQNAYYRVDDTSDIPDGTYAGVTVSASGPVQLSFVAPAGGIVYYGVVQLASVDGEFCETADVFTLTRSS